MFFIGRPPATTREKGAKTAKKTGGSSRSYEWIWKAIIFI